MKLIMAGAAMCALMFAACNKKPEAQADGSASGGPSTQVPARAAAKPLPHPEEMASPFAPPGVFFLVTKASVETDSGILNYLPGSKVIKSGSRYITSDGKALTLKADQITNDLRIAVKVAGNNPKLIAGIQASIRNTLATPNYMPPPKDEPQILAKPAMERRADGNGGARPTLDGDERKSDRSRR